MPKKVPCNIGVFDLAPGKRVIVCERVHINYEDEVEWICIKNFPFAVDFGTNTPFEYGKEKYHAKKDAATAHSKVVSEKNVINQEPHGISKTIKYSLAIYAPDLADPVNPDWENGEILVEDPEIIIDP